MKKIIFGGIILVVVAVFGGRALWLHQHKETEEKVVKIGHVAPLSGFVAEQSKAVLNGMILAQEEVNNAPFQYKGRKIKFVIEDGKDMSKDSVAAFNKLIAQGIDIAIISGDVAAPVVAPLIKQQGIPAVMTLSFNKEFLKYNSPKYMYDSFLDIRKIFYMLANRTVDRLGYKRVAIYALNAPHGKEAIKGIQEGLEGKDVKIVHTELFDINDKDCRAPIEKILSKKPDAVFCSGYGIGYSTGINMLRELGYKGPILSSTSFKDTGMKEHVKTDENIFFVQHADKSINGKKSSFAKAYKKRFKKEPDDLSVFGYYSVKLAAEAIKKAKTLNRADLIKSLNSIGKFETPIGTLQLNGDGSCDLDLFLAETIGDGKYKVLEVITPDGRVQKED